MSTEYIYEITISKRNADSFQVEKSLGESSGNLLAVISKFYLNLYQFSKEEFELQLKEQLALHGLNEDDIPF